MPGDVADRPDVLGGPHPLVDLDPRARPIVEPERVEPVDVRPPARRDQQPLERQPRRRRQAPTCCSLDRARPSAPSADLDAVLAERLVDERRRLGVDARQEPVAALDERDLRAHPGEELSQLAADRARRRARAAIRAPRWSRSPRRSSSSRRRRARGSAGSRARSRSRSRAGRSAARVPSTRTTPGPRPTRVAAHELAALAGEPLDLRRRRRARRPGRASAKIAGRVELAAGSTPGVRRDSPTSSRRPQHRLRRHAGPVGALAADEPALDERQLRVGRRAGGGRRRSARRSTLHRERRPAVTLRASPFAFRNAFATAAADCLSTSTALFMAMIAGSVSFAETALTVLVKLRAGRLARPTSSRSAPRSGSRSCASDR